MTTKLPAFALPDAVTNRIVESTEAAGRPVLVMFICNHCPYVVHAQSELTRLGKDYGSKGVFVVAVNSNSVRTHPQDGPANMKALAQKLGWEFPFVFDESQAVARAFGAACTPEFYVYRGDGSLAYHGQLDDSRPGSGKPVTGTDVRRALDAVLAGKDVPGDQRAAVGCSIKWDR